MNSIILSFSIVVLLGLWGNHAQAVCFKGDVSVNPVSDGPVISWSAEFRQSETVLIGTVLSAKNISDPEDVGSSSGTLYKLKVDTPLKGKIVNSAEVFSPNDSGRLPLAIGNRYILFLHHEGQYWIADPCGNTAKLVYPF